MNTVSKTDSDPGLLALDEKDKPVLIDALEKAVKSDDEVTCEVWRRVCSNICGEEKVLIRSYIRMIGRLSRR